jgi:hypothetical protein
VPEADEQIFDLLVADRPAESKLQQQNDAHAFGVRRQMRVPHMAIKVDAVYLGVAESS